MSNSFEEKGATASGESASPLYPLLKRDFRYFHEPITGTAMHAWIVGRRAHAKILADRLMYSKGGAFLITGFRGVGKTTFVHCALELIRSQKKSYANARGDFELLDVWINLSRPIQPSQLMHLIIRHLYLRLKEANLLAKLEPNLKEELEVAFLRTSFEISSKAMHGEEATRKAEFGYTPAKWLGLEFFGKLESTTSTKNSREKALQFLPYDDRAAEFDIGRFAQQLEQGFSEPPTRWTRIVRFLLRKAAPVEGRKKVKVVFVFDELDKLAKFSSADSDVLDSLLESLKGVFTSNEFSFVFIAGKEVYERWNADVALGDSIYESIFAYDFYVPCLWKEQEEFVQNCIAERLDKALEAHGPTWQLTRFLQYRGRGVLRRMLRELNNCIVWENDRPQISVPIEQRGIIGVYSKLQEVVSEKVELFGTDRERLDQARRDRRRLGLYYTLDWILTTRGEPFTAANIKSAAIGLKLGATTEWVSQEDYAERIIQMLLDRGFLESISEALTVIDFTKSSSRRYRLRDWVLLALEQAADPAVDSGSLEEPSPEYSLVPKTPSEIKRIGKYRVEGLLGRGGMGAVYQCVSPEGRKCAVKIIYERPEQEKTTTWEWFEREIQVLSKLRHPNIVEIFDHGTDGEQPFFVMEFVDGEPLSTVLKRVNHCDEFLAIRIVRSVAETFSYVHSQGVTRNDIKPSNMILTPRGSIKLVDFGIAAFLSDESDPPTNAEPSSIIGTLRYLSPERVNGKPATPQSDIFSLGIVLYELITGQSPFDGEDFVRTATNIVSSDPIPPSQLVPVNAELEDIVLQALAKDPAKRFSSMSQFAGRLKQLEIPVDLAELFHQSENIGQKTAWVRNEATASEVLSLGQIETIRETIEALGEGAIPSLSDLLHNSNARIRLATLMEIAQLNPKDIFDLLFDLAMDICYFTNPDKAKVSLRKGRVDLGRLPASDLWLARPEVSRHHLTFFIQDGKISVEALGSRHGVNVNGRPISRAELSEGDVITIAAIQIRIHIYKPGELTHEVSIADTTPSAPRFEANKPEGIPSSTIQQKYLAARDIPQVEYCDIAATFVTGVKEWHADFYDVTRLPGNRLGILFAGISGMDAGIMTHGVALRAVFAAFAPTSLPLSEMFQKANELVCERAEGRYATLIYGVLDSAGRFEFVNAGHVPPTMIKSSGNISLSQEGNYPLGLVPEAVYESTALQLAPGDCLVFYSDGVTEATNAREEMFGQEKTSELLMKYRDRSAEELLSALLQEVKDFTEGTPQIEDTLIFALRFGPTSKH